LFGFGFGFGFGWGVWVMLLLAGEVACVEGVLVEAVWWAVVS
jgi:hypothetical protein